MFACVIFSHEGQQSVFASSTQYTNTNTSCAISSCHRVHEHTPRARNTPWIQHTDMHCSSHIPCSRSWGTKSFVAATLGLTTTQQHTRPLWSCESDCVSHLSTDWSLLERVSYDKRWSVFDRSHAQCLDLQTIVRDAFWVTILEEFEIHRL